MAVLQRASLFHDSAVRMKQSTLPVAYNDHSQQLCS